MNKYKFFWFLRALFSKYKFGKIGKKCYFGKPIFISKMKSIYLGNEVRIFPGSRIECIDNGRIYIDDDVSIAQNLHLISFGGDLIIGKSSTISSNVFISNVNHTFDNMELSCLKQRLVYKETKIGERCFIGTGCVLLPGTILGNNCIVGANSVVLGKFGDGCMIIGSPAKVIKVYNEAKKEWEKI